MNKVWGPGVGARGEGYEDRKMRRQVRREERKDDEGNTRIAG